MLLLGCIVTFSSTGFYRVYGKLWNVVSDLNVVSIISKVISFAWGVATIVLIANYTGG